MFNAIVKLPKILVIRSQSVLICNYKDFRGVASPISHPFPYSLTHWLTKVTIRMSRHRDQKTLNQSLWTYLCISGILALPSLLTLLPFRLILPKYQPAEISKGEMPSLITSSFLLFSPPLTSFGRSTFPLSCPISSPLTFCSTSCPLPLALLLFFSKSRSSKNFASRSCSDYQVENENYTF